MKVILEQDVAKIGMRGDVVDVPNGYALNQLIPKGMAKPATGSNLKVATQQAATKVAQDEADAATFLTTAEALAAGTVTVHADTNDEGGLFKAVSPEDIAAAASEAGITVDVALIVVGEPIKTIGEHQVSLVRGNQSKEFTIIVAKNE